MKIDIESIRKIRVEPGDTLIVNLTRNISEDERRHMADILADFFSEQQVRVLILDPGVSLKKTPAGETEVGPGQLGPEYDAWLAHRAKPNEPAVTR